MTLSNGSVTESQSLYRNVSHNDTSSEQQGLLEGMKEDTNYKIVVIASNAVGSSPSSSPVYIKTLHGMNIIRLIFDLISRLKLIQSHLRPMFLENYTGSYHV